VIGHHQLARNTAQANSNSLELPPIPFNGGLHQLSPTGASDRQQTAWRENAFGYDQPGNRQTNVGGANSAVVKHWPATQSIRPPLGKQSRLSTGQFVGGTTKTFCQRDSETSDVDVGPSTAVWVDRGLAPQSEQSQATPRICNKITRPAVQPLLGNSQVRPPRTSARMISGSAAAKSTSAAPPPTTSRHQEAAIEASTSPPKLTGDDSLTGIPANIAPAVRDDPSAENAAIRGTVNVASANF